MKKTLPNLKIVSLDCLVLHEYVDPARIARLSRQIKKDNIFTNPPLVAKIDQTNKFVVLDGANRTTVFKNLGFKDIVVQIVDYNRDDLELKTWNHVIPGLKAKEFFGQIKGAVDNLMIKNFKLDGYKIICQPIFKNIFLDYIKALNVVVDLYAKRKFYRLDNQGDFSAQGNKTLIIFPRFKPEDIITVARKNLKVPSGITRHLIFGRALRVDLPMKILKQNKSLVWKNKQLNILIKQRFEQNKIRRYQEPVFIFND
ncbi:MAG: hypothetical protein WCX71_04410 [Candidatus Buchananbacteria bacterium]